MKTIAQLLCSLILVLFANDGFTQTGRIWVRISDPSFRDLVLGVTRKHPSLQNWMKLKNTFYITDTRLALPASKNSELKQVIEINCECNEQELLQRIAHSGLPFIKPEIGPHYQTLNIPNDYNSKFANDYALDLINAEGAWEITQGDPTITIAITDENYHLNHEELVDKYDFVTDNLTSSNYTHGTAVAITASGNTNNGVGKSSIGYKTRLQLRAMNYNEVLNASYSGAEVINLSWGSGCTYNTYHQQVINEVYANGSVLIASAGNGSTCSGATNLVYPASYDHVISVTSIGPNDNHERIIGNAGSTHQHNDLVDLAAPGYDIALSTSPGVYTTGNGTSFAAPLVSGLCGLMLSVNPCLSPDQVEFILKSTAVNIDSKNPKYAGQLGAGRINAQAALQMASKFNTFPMTARNTVNCAKLTQGVILDLSEGGKAPFSILWSNGQTNDTISGLAPGTYSVVVRDANRCLSSYSTTFEDITPIIIEESVTNPFCGGESTGSVIIKATGGFPPYKALWNTGETSQNLIGLKEGTYFVILTDQLGCSESETYQLLEPSLLEGGMVVTNILNSSDGAIDLNITGGIPPYTYIWSNGSNSEDQSGLDPGFYEVLIRDVNNCELALNTSLKIDGSSGLSNSSEINKPKPDFEGFYDPTKKELVFHWQRGGALQVTDILGKIVYIKSNLPYNGTDFIKIESPGTYLVRGSTEKGVQGFKFIAY
jgi:hypothetical protein